MRRRFLNVTEGRLEKVIAEHTDLSRNRARSIVERGGVRVDGVVKDHASTMVPAGAWVEVRSNAAPDARALLPIRYRDNSIIVVDKPAGMPSQPTRQGHAHHVYGIVAAQERYVGLHHRLDTPASGLMLLTLHPKANPEVAALFQEGKINREYRVAVLGDPGPEGTWETPVDNLPARTRFVREGQKGRVSLLRCTLETGRTHQIRQHALDAGFPVLGDRRYGGAAGRAWPRLALHAAVLRFSHPRTGRAVEVSAPLPADLCGLWGEAPPTAARVRRSQIDLSEPDGLLDLGEDALHDDDLGDDLGDDDLGDDDLGEQHAPEAMDDEG
jgi:23S rRNA pseudouridine1911/1915/1917 synthase